MAKIKIYLKSFLTSLSSIYFKLRNLDVKVCIGNNSLCLNNIVKKGKGNTIILYNGVHMKNCIFVFNGRNNTVRIGNNVSLKNTTFWFEDDHNTIDIGEGTTFEKNVQLAACEGTQINIGSDCMFSHDIYLRTTDSHPIINESGNRINEAKDITIGNHVWLGMQSPILKGAKISDNCVVAARALVTGSCHEPHSLIGGIPAKCLRKGINWKRFR